MSQLIITLLISISFAQDNSKDLIAKTYQQFYQKRNEFFRSDLGKENLKVKIADLLKSLESDLAEVDRIEAKNPAWGVTSEYNQMALEIALLSPLSDFSKTKMDKASCELAFHMNDMSESAETASPANRTKPVEKVLKKICAEK